MNRTAKILLVVSILCLLLGGALNLGWIKTRGVAALYTIFPLGAVFFGLFLIELVMQKEGRSHPEDRPLSEPSARDSVSQAPPKE